MPVTQTLRHLIGPITLIHEKAGPGLLRLTRLGVFALWIIKLSLDPLWRLAELPRDMFEPIGILALLPTSAIDALLHPLSLYIFLLTTLVVLAIGLTNRAFPIVATIAAILLTAYSCLIRGYGPAVHTDIVLLFAVYVLAAFAWADLLVGKCGSPLPSVEGREGTRVPTMNMCSYPLVTIVALLCFSYCLVGFNRVSLGGLRVFTGDTMEVWAIDASLRAYYFNTNIGWHIPEWPLVVLMLKLGLPVITLFEMTAPLCLVSSHFRWIFIPVMLSFHLLSLVVMNIFFFDDMLLYLLLIDWSRRYPSLSRSRTVKS
jgi:hypothetical protein